MIVSDDEKDQIIARLKGKEVEAFKRYIRNKLSPQEKQELQEALNFYNQNVPE